ncbi:hypothetical protein NU10_04200 [Flavobacterium dauae]|uniref:hypothetical protein n=1 Tax=Flavobacterium dauae TaxID=1563479 RepID=UPI00101B3E67|nr:hypothetical protein [Flavobacterium dauae]WLD24607.1 hypothetical protein NU10_04200 [Flavobacterium dauae]
MKKLFLILLLGVSQLSLAQNHKIVTLFNKQLQKEMTHFYTDEERKNFIVTEAFRIDKNNILHFGYTIKSYDGGKISVYSQIPLNKIMNIGKDYTIYFESLDNDVTQTQTHYEKNGNILKTKTDKTHLFSTEINKEHYPNRFMKRLAKALRKIGYDVECGY